MVVAHADGRGVAAVRGARDLRAEQRDRAVHLHVVLSPSALVTVRTLHPDARGCHDGDYQVPRLRDALGATRSVTSRSHWCGAGGALRRSCARASDGPLSSWTSINLDSGRTTSSSMATSPMSPRRRASTILNIRISSSRSWSALAIAERRPRATGARASRREATSCISRRATAGCDHRRLRSRESPDRCERVERPDHLRRRVHPNPPPGKEGGVRDLLWRRDLRLGHLEPGAAQAQADPGRHSTGAASVNVCVQRMVDLNPSRPLRLSASRRPATW